MKPRFKFAKLLYISLLELDKINRYAETKIHEVKKYANRMDKKRTKDIFAKLGCSHGLIVIKPWLINTLTAKPIFRKWFPEAMVQKFFFLMYFN